MSFPTLQTRVVEPGPYVRSVEVVALDTLGELLGGDIHGIRFHRAATNIFRREPYAHAETAAVLRCGPVDVVPHPVWKVIGRDRYWVDEIGHSDHRALKGVEHWPDWRGRYDIRHGDALVEPVPGENGPFFLLGGDSNHYHWVLNFVPRLMLLEQATERFPELAHARLLVPDAIGDNALRLLVALGVDEDRVVRVGGQQVLRLNQLYVPSLFQAFELSPEVFAWYRRKLAHRRKGPPTRRVVISRGENGGIRHRRCVVNETEVLDALRPLGFEPYNLGAMSIDEQIELFLDARMVIGPHGAGFGNMVFSEPGVAAIVLENSWAHTFMVDLVNTGGGQGRVLVCDDVFDAAYEAPFAGDAALAAEVRRNRDMRVDVPSLLRLTREMLESEAPSA
jgi:capsular polysaccharide biosynthesis protein